MGEEEIHPAYFDDMSGKPLDPELVYRARCDELQEFKRYEVYDKVPRRQRRMATRRRG